MPGKNKGKNKRDKAAAASAAASASASVSPPPAPAPPPWVAAELEHGVSVPDEHKEVIQLETIEKACNDHSAWTSQPDGVLGQLGILLNRLMVMQRWHRLKRRPGATEAELYEGWDVFRASPRELPPVVAGEIPAATWARFWEWVESRYPEAGGSEPGSKLQAMRGAVEVGWMGEERGHGVRALRDIKADEEIMRVPAELMMSVEWCEREELGGCFVGLLARTDPLIAQTPTLALALLLAHEKLRGDASPFAPYVAVLPETYAVPLFWQPIEVSLLAMLHVPHTHARALNSWRMVAKQYCYVTKMLLQRARVSGAAEGAQGDDVATNPLSPGRLRAAAGEFQRELSFELFRWAMAAVITRQNEVPAMGEPTGEEPKNCQPQVRPVLALIPIWDMCNHCEGMSVTYFEGQAAGDHSTPAAAAASSSPSSFSASSGEDGSKASKGRTGHGALVCKASAAIGAGDEVCIFYGPRPNAELLCYSGFVHGGNSFDRAQVSWELSGEGHPNPRLMKKQLMILKNLPNVVLATRDEGRTHRVTAAVMAPRERKHEQPPTNPPAATAATAAATNDGEQPGASSSSSSSSSSLLPLSGASSGGLSLAGESLAAALRASCIKDEAAAGAWLRDILTRKTAQASAGGAASDGPTAPSALANGHANGHAYGAAELELLRRVSQDRSRQLRADSARFPKDWPPRSSRDTARLSAEESHKYAALHDKLHAGAPRFAPLVHALVKCEADLLESVASMAVAAAAAPADDQQQQQKASP